MLCGRRTKTAPHKHFGESWFVNGFRHLAVSFLLQGQLKRGDSMSSEFLQKVKELENDIKHTEKELVDKTERAKSELSSLGYLGSFGDIDLYYDCVKNSNRTLKINSGIEAAAMVNGEVFVTTNVHGGGARPTLTRVAVGAIVAGPLGALIGGAAQKHKKIKTENEVHDTRTYRVVISSKEGYIDTTVTEPSDPQAFVGKILNAVADYDKNKKVFDQRKKQLEEQIKDCTDNKELKKKKEELKKILEKATPEQKKELEKNAKALPILAFAFGIVSILCFWNEALLGLFSLTALIISIISLNKKSPWFKNGKTLSIIGIVLGGISILIFMALYQEHDNKTFNNPSTNTNTSSSKTIDKTEEKKNDDKKEIDKKKETVKNYEGQDAKKAYDELTQSGYEIVFRFDRANNAGFTEKDLYDFMLESFNSTSYYEMPLTVTFQTTSDKKVFLYVEYSNLVQ